MLPVESFASFLLAQEAAAPEAGGGLMRLALPVLVIGFSTSLLKQLMPKTKNLEGLISFGVGNILIVSGIFLITLS